MKVALLHAFAAEAGGAEAHVTRLHHLLAARGHQTLLVDLERDAAFDRVAAFAPQIVHLHNLDSRHTHIVDRIAAGGWPIVRTLHDHSLICPAGSLFAKGQRCERCTSGGFHHAGLNGCVNLPAAVGMSLAATFGQWPSTRGVLRFVTSSDALAARVTRSGMRGRVDVIGTFVPEDRLLTSEPATEKLVIAAGRLVVGKGFDTLLSAAQGLDAQVVIMGSGPLFGPLAARIRAERLFHVKLIGHLSGRAYLDQLRRAAIVVVPSEAAEVTPTMVCEAMAAGIPVIASAVDSVPELIGRDERGVLVPPGDAGALRQAIARLLDDVEQRRKMGRVAQAYAREHLSAERYHGRLTALYAEVAAGHA